MLLVWNLTRLRTQLARLKQDRLQPGDNYQSKVNRCIPVFSWEQGQSRGRRKWPLEKVMCSVPGSSRKIVKKQRGKSEGAINRKGKQGSLYERWLLGDG